MIYDFYTSVLHDALRIFIFYINFLNKIIFKICDAQDDNQTFANKQQNIVEQKYYMYI